MEESIKEILDELESLFEISEAPEHIINGLNKIKDYIINLQEENKQWSIIFDTFSKRPYAHKYLEEKKKELRNENITGLDSEMIYKDYYKLKSRNEKANNILKHTSVDMPEILLIETIDYVRRILNGGDE